ncbi:MAG: alpha/beta hydrolase [Flavobacteriales bacterium]|nr:alpha/beta hydrolase [Flavobacteriales bacterium]
MESKTIYFISGLGADERAFERINEFADYQKVYLNGIPFVKGEGLKKYTTRLISNHNIGVNDVLIGLSFGGLVAQQIAALTPINTVVLISSFRSDLDLKPLWQSLLKFRVYYLMPPFRIALMSKVVRKWFNVRTKEGIVSIEVMVSESDLKMVKWSMEEMRKAKQ